MNDGVVRSAVAVSLAADRDARPGEGAALLDRQEKTSHDKTRRLPRSGWDDGPEHGRTGAGAGQGND